MPNYVKQLIAGGVAGGLSKTAVAPLERVKILYQIKHGNFQSMGVWRSLMCILKTEGPRGFYKGNGASVMRIVPYAALNFAAYEQYRHWILEGYPAAGTGPVVDLVAGSLAGGTAVLCTYPLDLARTRLAYQVKGLGNTLAQSAVLPAPYKGVADVCSRVIKERGIRGLYRGLCPTLYGILPYAGLKFFAYETLKSYLPGDTEPSIAGKLACGAAAGVFGQTVTYPLDVVRRQMQVQSENALVDAQFKGTLNGLSRIAQTQGWKQLFAGLGINYLKLVPSAAIGFAAYDSMKVWLRVPPRERRP
ncbi:unnamed protein product [Sphagnum troendelagicum]